MAFHNFFRPHTDPSVATNPSLVPPTPRDVRDAYARGQRDALRARKRHPLGMTLLFGAAAAGVAILSYAAYSGSFSRGGARLDQDLAIAADRAEPMVREAAHDAGQAAKGAGQSLMRDAPAPPKPN
jgi:hypothetical protein